MTYNNGFFKDELEIIECFQYEMNGHGYENYYSFNRMIDNGFFIYKKDDKWYKDINKNGETIITKGYTNIYNLCLDILKEVNVTLQYPMKVPRGTKVIITKFLTNDEDIINEGIIIENNKLSKKDVSSERVYKVLGDDGLIYNGLYGSNMHSDVCFRTMEDYIEDLHVQISKNNVFIRKIHDINWDMYLRLNTVVRKKDQYLEENNKIKRK